MNIGWKTWMIFGTVNATAFILCFWLPETGNLSLEETDILFGVVDRQAREDDVEARMRGDSKVIALQGKH